MTALHEGVVRNYNPTTKEAEVVVPGLTASTPVRCLPFVLDRSDMTSVPLLSVNDVVLVYFKDEARTTAPQWIAANYVQTDYVDITWFGASPTASVATNDAAIQKALDVAAATGRKVYIPPGTYLIGNGRRGVFGAILTISTGTRVYGEGLSSVLKVADGFTAGGDYRIFAPSAAVTTDNVEFFNFTLDGNAANNIVLGSTGGLIRRAYMIQVDRGENVNVEKMTLINSPGRNVLLLGNNANPPSIKNGHIVRNTVARVGGGFPGNHLQLDHSSFYAQFDGGEVADNFLWQDPFDPSSPNFRSVCAMEIHGTRTAVRDNHIYNYQKGGNAVSTVHDNTGSVWENNTFEGVGAGIDIWSWSPFKMIDLIVKGNTVRGTTAYGGFIGGIQQTVGSVTSPPRNLHIINNTVETDSASGVAEVGHGITVRTGENVHVSGNIVRNIPGNGIQFDAVAASTLPLTDVQCVNNTVENVGFSAAANRLWGIWISNASTAGAIFKGFRISGNKVGKKTAAGPMRGLQIVGGGRIEDVTVDGDNEWNNIANPAVIMANVATIHSNTLLPEVLIH